VIACPLCGAKTATLETRTGRAGVRRRRGCMIDGCAGRVTTVEVVVGDEQDSASLTTGASVLVPVRQLKKLQEIAALVCGGVK
jgi:hypothetical protein